MADLAKTRHRLFTCTYPGTPLPEAKRTYTNYELDIADAPAVQKMMRQAKPELVFHLAAVIKNDRSWETMEQAMRTNVTGTLNLLCASAQTGVRRFINMSTCEVYGQGRTPFVETQPLQPISPYSASKAMVDLLCGMLRQSLRLPVVTLRFTLVYGPHQAEGMFIPQVILTALRRKDFAMTKGQQTRNFVYVDDAVKALRRAARTKGIEGEIFNIGTDEEYTVGHVARTIIARMGNPIALHLGQRSYRKPEIWRYRCDFKKAQRLLGWSARVGFEEGIAKTIKWYTERFKAGLLQ